MEEALKKEFFRKALSEEELECFSKAVIDLQHDESGYDNWFRLICYRLRTVRKGRTASKLGALFNDLTKQT